MKYFLCVLLFVVVILIAPISWAVNVYKLTQCDFEPNYRCEVIHAVGILPPAALVTVWMGTDK